MNARQRAYYLKRKEKVRAMKSTPEAKAKTKTYNQAYYEANRERIAIRNKAYREANKEKLRKYQQEYRKRKKEEAQRVNQGQNPGSL